MNLRNHIFSIIGLALLLLWYVSPLFNSTQMAMKPGDPFAFATLHPFFCKNFPFGSFFSSDYFAPNGVMLSMNYDMPFILYATCLLRFLGTVAVFNVQVITQVILIFATSYYCASVFLKNPFLRLFFVFMYSFSSFTLARLTGHVSLLSTVWSVSLVFTTLYSISLTSRLHVVLFFVILGFVLGSAWQNWPNLFLPLIVMAVWKLLQYPAQKRKTIIINVFIGLILMVAIAGIFAYPMMRSEINRNTWILQSNLEFYSADILSFIIPWKQSVYISLFDSPARHLIVDSFESSVSIDLFVLSIFVFSLFRAKFRVVPQWKLLFSLILVSFILSLGPRILFEGTYLFEIPFVRDLFQIPPYSMTRTPARLGIVAVFAVTLFVSLFIERWFEMKKYRIELIAIILFVYALLITTIGSNNVKVPSFPYLKNLPMKALKEIKEDKSKSIVMNIPLAFGVDQYQNWLYEFHRKPIAVAYISYIGYSRKTLSLFEKYPLLQSLECNSSSSVVPHVLTILKKQKIRYLILNNTLLGEEKCMGLKNKLAEILQETAVKPIEESQSFSVYVIL